MHWRRGEAKEQFPVEEKGWHLEERPAGIIVSSLGEEKLQLGTLAPAWQEIASPLPGKAKNFLAGRNCRKCNSVDQ